MRTAIGHELVDSNTQINFVNLIIPTFIGRIYIIKSVEREGG